MSLNDINMADVEESKDFGAVKKCTTRIRIVNVERVDVPDKDYKEYYNLQTEFVDPSSVEAIDPNETPSSPFVKLYFHTPGARGMAKRTLESLGLSWDDFVASTDREGFLQGLAGAEADVKIIVETHRKDTGEELEKPRNNVRFLAQKKVA